MAAEGWCDGTWNDWRWKTPDHRSSSSSSIPQAGCGTTRDDLRFGKTEVGDKGIRSLTPPVVIHGSTVGNGPRFFPRWTKSWLGGRPACWTPAKAKPKNRLTLGAGDGKPQAGTLQGAVPLHQRQLGCTLPN